MSVETATAALAAIVAPDTGRDLPGATEPLSVRLEGSAGTAAIRLIAGSQPSVQINLSSDRVWLNPGRSEVNLGPGESVDVVLEVGAEDDGDFAVLELSWTEGAETLREHVLVQRHRSASAATLVEAAQMKSAEQEVTGQENPAKGVSKKPIWLEEMQP